MKTERIVQVLFYLLITIIVLGLIEHNSKPLITPGIRNVVIYVILASIIGFLFYYYLPKKKKH